jgi:hypothetical protein
MNFKKINSDLLDLIELRNQIAEMPYNSDDYDELEDEIADFEDTFNERYGKNLEAIAQKIHNELMPSSEVLVATAYVAKRYTPSVIDEEDYDINPKEGVIFSEPDGDKVLNVRLVLYPNPVKFVYISKNDPKIVWTADKPDEFNF